MAMLAVKGDYYLTEYISALKHSLDINGIQPPPADDHIDTSSTRQASFEPAKNLFEGFRDYDLSFLHGYAIIIPQGDIKDYDRKRDHVIKLLHPFYSQEFEVCAGNAELRLDALFKVKERWTRSELEAYIAPYIDLTAKFDQYLLKNTKILREKNPFDPAKEVAFYIRKF